MPVVRTVCALAAVFAVGVFSSGCPGPVNNAAATKKTDAHDHDHAHEHVHHGPHEGKLMVLGAEAYHAEWTHDESGKVTFYLLDAAAKQAVPIAAEQITIDVKIGDNPPKSYELLAVNPEDGKAAAFEIVDKQFEALFDQLKSSGVTLTLHVNINGQQFDQPVKEHEHGH